MKVLRNLTFISLMSILFIQCKKDNIDVYQSDWVVKKFADWERTDANTRLTTTFSAPEISVDKLNKSNISVYLKMQSNVTQIPTRLLDGKLIMTEISAGQIKIIIQSNTVVNEFEDVAFRYIVEH